MGEKQAGLAFSMRGLAKLGDSELQGCAARGAELRRRTLSAELRGSPAVRPGFADSESTRDKEAKYGPARVGCSGKPSSLKADSRRSSLLLQTWLGNILNCSYHTLIALQ